MRRVHENAAVDHLLSVRVSRGRRAFRGRTKHLPPRTLVSRATGALTSRTLNSIGIAS